MNEELKKVALNLSDSILNECKKKAHEMNRARAIGILQIADLSFNELSTNEQEDLIWQTLKNDALYLHYYIEYLTEQFNDVLLSNIEMRSKIQRLQAPKK